MRFNFISIFMGMKTIIIRGFIFFTLFSGFIVYQLGWLTGAIVFAAAFLFLLIGTGALGHIILWLKDKLKKT